MAKNNFIWVVLGILILLVVVFHSSFGITFSTLTSTRTCDSWLTNQGLPSPLALPYNWYLSASQTRCITALTPSNGGCKVTYTTGACSGQQQVCTQQAKVCSDGSYVYPDPNNNCVIPSCPSPNTCISNWVIGDWSSCSSSGVKTRSVVDTNNCPSNSRPASSQSCTPPNNGGGLGDYTWWIIGGVLLIVVFFVIKKK